MGPSHPHLRLPLRSRVGLAWSEVLGQPANGHVLGYKVAYRRSDESNAFFFGIPDTLQILTVMNSTAVDVAGLRPFLKYEFQVAAFTRVGTGPYTPILQVVTAESTPSAGPEVTGVVVVNTTATIEWEPVGSRDQRGEWIIC